MKLPVLAAVLALATPALAQPVAPEPPSSPIPPPPPADVAALPDAPPPTPVKPPLAPTPEPVGAPVAPPATAPPATPAVVVTTALGKGIQIAAPDDSARMEIRARLQLRASQFSEGDGDAPNVTEFQARRVRLQIKGHVFGGDWKYTVQLAFSNLDMEPDLRSPLRDANITYGKLRDLNVRMGQMKVPFGKQRVVSSSAQQMADRSIVVGELNLDRDVGIQALSEDLGGWDGKLAYNVGVFSGDGRNRLATAPGVLAVGRLVLRPFGGFEDTSEVDFDRTPTPKVALAIGAAHNNNTNRPRSTLANPYEFARFDYTHATADLVLKYRGLYVSSELIYRKASKAFEEQDVDGDGMLEREYARNAWGYYAQAGYLFPSQVEVVGRYGEFRPRGETDPALEERHHELGGGLNYYWQKHDLKLQSDYFYLWKEDTDAARHQIRVQLQLYY